MKSWIPKPPTASSLLDHDVETLGSYLKGKRIALMVCGGIAAMKAPLIARALRRYQADVVAFVTDEALKYTTIDALEWSTYNKVVKNLSPWSEHLSKEKPFDAFLLAPATYNSINKLRHGIADTPVTTTLAAALSLVVKKQTQMFIAPTMHGDFHNTVLEESLNFLSQLGVKIIPPRDAYGKHNLPEPKLIAAFLSHHMSTGPLQGKDILVTSGSTPVFIDSVRCISNRFRGRLGLEISKHLFLSGANVLHLYGSGSVEPEDYLESIKVQDFEEYRDMVLKILKEKTFDAGIFSAAVADYKPEKTFIGKIKSNGALKSVDFLQTEKVIDMVQEQHPTLPMISFKFESNISKEDLFEIGHRRIQRGHRAVVANRDEDTSKKGEQKAYLLTEHSDPLELNGKPEIANAVADYLETIL
ncbi:MAG: phosphopantothenoylcysteine decarboxylase [Pseudobdellovibrionaceae bacterium]